MPGEGRAASGQRKWGGGGGEGKGPRGFVRPLRGEIKSLLPKSKNLVSGLSPLASESVYF